MIPTATGIGGFVFTALTGVMADHLGMRMAMEILAAFYIFSIASAIYVTRKFTGGTDT